MHLLTLPPAAVSRYSLFKEATEQRRRRLEDARRFMYFKRDADELESWINEKLQTASDESYRDPTNLQVNTHLDCGCCLVLPSDFSFVPDQYNLKN